MKNKNIILLIAVSFLTRCVLASLIELNNDEVYYWTYAKKLQWNYFDHPPGIALLLKIFTFNLHFQQEFFLRLGSMVCSALSTWIIYQIGKKINSEQTGLTAAILFTASPYCSIIAGLLVIPDAPQLVWWLASVWLMLSLADTNMRRKEVRWRLLLLGFTIGGCMLCKVHGIFLWIGFLLYVVLYQRQLLKSPWLFYALFITALVFSPVVFWNIDNDFITYTYHSNRVSFFSSVHIDSFFRELFGEMAYNNPFIFVSLIASLVAVFRNRLPLLLPWQRLLLLVSLPMIILVLFMSIFRDTLPHWTGPAYTTLIPLVAVYLVSSPNLSFIPITARRALGFTIILLIPVLLMVKWLPYNIGNKKSDRLGDGDPTLDMAGFKNFGRQFDYLYKSDISNGAIHPKPFVVSEGWFPSGHMDYYVARTSGLSFTAVGDLNAIHQYAWLNQYRPVLQRNEDAYYITVSNYFRPPPENLEKLFESTSAADVITQYRGNVPVRNFFIYRLRGYKTGLPVSGVIND